MANLMLIMLMCTYVVYPYCMIPSYKLHQHIFNRSRSSMNVKDKNNFKIYLSSQDSTNNVNRNNNIITNNSSISINNINMDKTNSNSNTDNNIKMDGNYVRLKGNNNIYNVKLPNGMNIPTLTSKEQQLIDMKEAMQSNSSYISNNDVDGTGNNNNDDDVDKNRRPSDLDVLREQMRLLLERMS